MRGSVRGRIDAARAVPRLYSAPSAVRSCFAGITRLSKMVRLHKMPPPKRSSESDLSGESCIGLQTPDSRPFPFDTGLRTSDLSFPIQDCGPFPSDLDPALLRNPECGIGDAPMGSSLLDFRRPPVSDPGRRTSDLGPCSLPVAFRARIHRFGTICPWFRLCPFCVFINIAGVAVGMPVNPAPPARIRTCAH
jgi:hypothetical protein